MRIAFSDLPYPKDALEPGCSARTVSVHYDKHHRAYFDKTVELIKNTRFEDMTLEQIIRQTEPLNFNRRVVEDPSLATEHMWGFCKGCYYADVCRGGCSWTAHVFYGKRGNNPYCHHRALEQQAQGKRERLVQVAPAPGEPFDHGLFEIVEEPWA